MEISSGRKEGGGRRTGGRRTGGRREKGGGRREEDCFKDGGGGWGDFNLNAGGTIASVRSAPVVKLIEALLLHPFRVIGFSS
eukprot:553296-Hanusia_phi.AAC.1